MKELLTEFFANILGETGERKFKARSKESGRIVPFKSQDALDAAVKAGTHEPVKKPKASKQPAATKAKAPAKKAPVKKTTAKKTTAQKPAKAEKPKTVQAVIEEPDEDTNAKGVYDENDPMQRSVVEAGNPRQLHAALDGLASDEASKVYDGEVVVGKDGKKTKKPKVGPGGLVASTGETLCTETQTAMANGEYDSAKTRKTPAYKKKRAELQKELDGLKDSRRAARVRYYQDLATMHGFFDEKGNPDVGAAMDMEAEAQVWVEEKDREFRKTLVGSKFPSDESRRSWLTAAFHSGYSLQNNGPSGWDKKQPSRVLKANSRTDGAVQTMLERKRDAAKTPEERAHYDEQLEVWKKFQPYHDTYMVYTDKNGRTAVYHISNKKSSDLIDPHNNTTPAKRVAMFIQAAREAGHTDGGGSARAIAEPIARAEQKARRVIDNNDAVVLDADAGFASIPAGTPGKPSANARVMGAMASHLPGGGNRPTKEYYDEMVRHKKFAAYLQQRKINPKDTAAVSAAAVEYVKQAQNNGEDVPAPVFKFALKLGQMSQNIYDRAESGKSPKEIAASLRVPVSVVEAVLASKDMKRMATMKATHAAGLTGAYSSFVEDLHRIDGTEPGGSEDNGPAVETFVRGTLAALHVDTYIRNYDEHIQVESGGVGTKPVDVRNCMAKLSGFEGDTSTPKGRAELMNHLGKKIRVEPGSDRMYLVSSELDEKGKPKKIYIAEEMWRGSGGKGKKVTSGFGDDLRKCLKEETGRRLRSRKQ